MMDFSISNLAARIRVGPFLVEIKRKADKGTDKDTDDLLRRRKEVQDELNEIDKELKEQDGDRIG